MAIISYSKEVLDEYLETITLEDDLVLPSFVDINNQIHLEEARE